LTYTRVLGSVDAGVGAFSPLEVNALNSHHHRGALVLISALFASGASAGEGGGGLVGWVESTHGTPVAGAVISVFGKGMGNGGFVTLTDSAGQFVLPRLPAGSYTLRALDRGHVPYAARKFTVLPDRDAMFTVSLTPIGETASPARSVGAVGSAPAEDEDATALREWRWLLRHKRRSVLEDRSEDPLPAGAVRVADTMPLRSAGPWFTDLGGSVELVASPVGAFLPADVSMAGQGALRLRGRLADSIQWNLGGLVTESEGTSWRMAAEFVLRPGGGHAIEAGAGYGMGLTRRFGAAEDQPIDPQGVGAMFVRTRLKLAEHLTASLGTRYSYFGFLEDTNHLDPMLAIELETTPGTVVRASAVSRTLAPGGDLLTLSTRDSSPYIAYAAIGDRLHPSKTARYELAVDRSAGSTTLGGRAFYEGTVDQIVNVFEGYPSPRSLRMFNVSPLSARGVGFTLGRHFGGAVSGSVTYTYGFAERRETPGSGFFGLQASPSSFRRGDFHDVEARLHTFIELTDTRLEAFCRINSFNPDAIGPGGALANTRFDVQLTQGLPFLQPLTRADWEVLVQFRNLFYERGEGGLFDELVVLHPPKRVVGGIAVKF
jgi:hypothetical protein